MEEIRLDEDTVLKTAGPKGLGGSSPSSSAFHCHFSSDGRATDL